MRSGRPMGSRRAPTGIPQGGMVNRRSVFVTGIVVFFAYEVMLFLVYGLWLAPTYWSSVWAVLDLP